MQMHDSVKTAAMMNDAAVACKTRKEDNIRKARGLCLFADWFLRAEDKDKTLEYCAETEKILPCSEELFESLWLYLDVSTIYFLLGLEDSSRKSSQNAAKIIPHLSEPKKKATALLKLSESQLNICLGEPVPLSECLAGIKKQILNAAAIADSLPESPQEIPSGSPAATLNLSVLTNPQGHEDFPAPEILSKNDDALNLQAFSRRRLHDFKNELLRKVVSIQAWGTTLEETWDTIEDIDSESDRDDALVVTIEMMLATHADEDLGAWEDEIVNPVKKTTILQKINKQ
jgi:hypothetical protein